MPRRAVGILALCALVLSIQSCTRVQPPLTLTSIPANWGNLVSASPLAEQPELTQLWFQDADGNLRVVVYHVRQNTLLSMTTLRRH